VGCVPFCTSCCAPWIACPSFFQSSLGFFCCVFFFLVRSICSHFLFLVYCLRTDTLEDRRRFLRWVFPAIADLHSSHFFDIHVLQFLRHAYDNVDWFTFFLANLPPLDLFYVFSLVFREEFAPTVSALQFLRFPHRGHFRFFCLFFRIFSEDSVYLSSLNSFFCFFFVDLPHVFQCVCFFLEPVTLSHPPSLLNQTKTTLRVLCTPFSLPLFGSLTPL